MTEFLANDAARIAMLLLLFVAVVGVAYGIAITLGERRQVRGRLAGDAGYAGSDEDNPVEGLRAHDARGAWVQLVTAIESAGIPLVDTKDATLRSRLVAAGYRQEYAPRAYSLLRLGLVIGLPIAVALASGVILGEYVAQPLKREARRLESRLSGPRLVGPLRARAVRRRPQTDPR